MWFAIKITFVYFLQLRAKCFHEFRPFKFQFYGIKIENKTKKFNKFR